MMTFEALGNLGDFVGGIGVVVTLIYLAIQVRENTHSLQVNGQQSLLDNMNRINESVSDNADLAEILLKSQNGLNHLSLMELIRFEHLCDRYFTTFELAYVLNSRGLIPPELWLVWQNEYRYLLSTSALACWDEVKMNYLPDFAKELDSYH
jgi:hypothetical protein